MYRLLIIFLCALASVFNNAIYADDIDSPKREFRGAWMHTVFQEQYLKQSTATNKRYISAQLDSLAAAGINCVFFQVRPQADAFYKSDIEPWSMFLTNDGKAPEPFWDPLEYIVTEAHKRAMELHAWINPYRVTSSKKQRPAKGHLYYRKPKRFISYDGKIYFDPGLPENRKYICTIVEDIVKRYDIDGIHLDDYFYPYPVKGLKFNDTASFKRYGGNMELADWRRDNVNKLIEELSRRIKAIKPWVRFGVSPFGIWRNRKSDKRGSETDGLANYDDLYADVLLWTQNGWIDYVTPQLYWNTDHPKASYDVLLKWWNDNANNRHVYIGQSIPITMKSKSDKDKSEALIRLNQKISATRQAKNINGNCWWPAYSLTANEKNILKHLKDKHQSKAALMPSYPWIWNVSPEGVYDIKTDGDVLRWNSQKTEGSVTDVVRFVVYRFDETADEFDLETAANIECVTSNHKITVERDGYYIITALDRVNNESLPSEPILVKVKHKH